MGSALRLVEPLHRASVIDVDHLPHLVVAGTPPMGRKLGIAAAAHRRRECLQYLHWGTDTVLSDVLNDESALPPPATGILMVQLRMPLPEARGELSTSVSDRGRVRALTHGRPTVWHVITSLKVGGSDP